MKFSSSWDEWYPVRVLDVSNDLEPRSKDFTEAEIVDIRRVQQEFTDWQTKIAERFGEEPPHSMDYLLVEPD
jgi:hypothetical protein